MPRTIIPENIQLRHEISMSINYEIQIAIIIKICYPDCASLHCRQCLLHFHEFSFLIEIYLHNRLISNRAHSANYHIQFVIVIQIHKFKITIRSRNNIHKTWNFIKLSFSCIFVIIKFGIIPNIPICGIIQQSIVVKVKKLCTPRTCFFTIFNGFFKYEGAIFILIKILLRILPISNLFPNSYQIFKSIIVIIKCQYIGSRNWIF